MYPEHLCKQNPGDKSSVIKRYPCSMLMNKNFLLPSCYQCIRDKRTCQTQTQTKTFCYHPFINVFSEQKNLSNSNPNANKNFLLPFFYQCIFRTKDSNSNPNSNQNFLLPSFYQCIFGTKDSNSNPNST